MVAMMATTIVRPLQRCIECARRFSTTARHDRDHRTHKSLTPTQRLRQRLLAQVNANTSAAGVRPRSQNEEREQEPPVSSRTTATSAAISPSVLSLVPPATVTGSMSTAERVQFTELIGRRRRAQLERFNSPIIQSLLKSPTGILYQPSAVGSQYVPLTPPPAFGDVDDNDVLNEFSQPNKPRSLNISIIGAANSGKSSLANALIGSKVSAVSPKRNTTRTSVLGVSTVDNTQLIIYDTPGIIETSQSKQYERELSTDAWSASSHVDTVILMIDSARRQTNGDKQLLTRIQQFTDRHTGITVILALNKVDLVRPKTELLVLANELVTLCPVIRDVFYLSVTDNDGVQELKDHLVDCAVNRDWEWESGTVTDLSPMQRIAEIIREKIFLRVHDEVPYQTQQVNVSYTKIDERTLRIDQQIRVDTNAQKSILIGSNGSTLQWIQREAAAEIARVLNVERVLLYLSVQKGKKTDPGLIQGIRTESDSM